MTPPSTLFIESGLLVLLPVEAARRWTGVYDRDGEFVDTFVRVGRDPTDAELACEANSPLGVVPFDDRTPGADAAAIFMGPGDVELRNGDGVQMLVFRASFVEDELVERSLRCMDEGEHMPYRRRVRLPGREWIAFEFVESGRDLPTCPHLRGQAPSELVDLEYQHITLEDCCNVGVVRIRAAL